MTGERSLVCFVKTLGAWIFREAPCIGGAPGSAAAVALLRGLTLFKEVALLRGLTLFKGVTLLRGLQVVAASKAGVRKVAAAAGSTAVLV
jgi:hypothetical protein